MHSVPFFDYQALFRQHGNAMMAIIADCAERGALIMQQELLDFETKLAKFIGVDHAIGVGNCTDGLYLALSQSGIGAGDEVIFPAHTFVATAGAIKQANAIPVPVECGTDHLIDPNAIEQAITRNTRALLPVQLNGRVAQMDHILAIAKQHDLLVIEDAAQALGATFQGKKAGSFGLASAFSFYPAKLVGGLGDGGAVVTNDAVLANKIRAARDHGRDPEQGTIQFWGMNSRLDTIQAAVLSYLLDHFDEVIIKRRHLANLYNEQLHDLDDLTLPPAPSDQGANWDVFQNYEIETSHRDQLKAYLNQQGIGTALPWGGQAVHQWANLGFSCALPVTERILSRSLMLPLNMAIKDADVRSVCQTIRGFYEQV
ncbi:MAG: DegT/DnrJ/EryC1/StrS family aminotransferase [Magnetococcales bacterium]|nr:DegT/DnrJ/EryC1/StrS family aminotransferase [Magnetococcales bacterium]